MASFRNKVNARLFASWLHSVVSTHSSSSTSSEWTSCSSQKRPGTTTAGYPSWGVVAPFWFVVGALLCLAMQQQMQQAQYGSFVQDGSELIFLYPNQALVDSEFSLKNLFFMNYGPLDLVENNAIPMGAAASNESGRTLSFWDQLMWDKNMARKKPARKRQKHAAAHPLVRNSLPVVEESSQRRSSSFAPMSQSSSKQHRAERPRHPRHSRKENALKFLEQRMLLPVHIDNSNRYTEFVATTFEFPGYIPSSGVGFGLAVHDQELQRLQTRQAANLELIATEFMNTRKKHLQEKRRHKQNLRDMQTKIQQRRAHVAATVLSKSRPRKRYRRNRKIQVPTPAPPCDPLSTRPPGDATTITLMMQAGVQPAPEDSTVFSESHLLVGSCEVVNNVQDQVFLTIENEGLAIDEDKDVGQGTIRYENETEDRQDNDKRESNITFFYEDDTLAAAEDMEEDEEELDERDGDDESEDDDQDCDGIRNNENETFATPRRGATAKKATISTLKTYFLASRALSRQ